MRNLLLTVAILFGAGLSAAPVTIHVFAPDHTDQAVVLYRYDDLFTLRTVRLTDAVLNSEGTAVLVTEMEGTVKARIRIGDVIADLYLRPGQDLHVQFPKPDPGVAASLNGRVRVDLLFNDLSALDINALTTDLNERIDAFILADLATDEEAGMNALDQYRRADPAGKDSLADDPSIHVVPTWSPERLDSFELKLRHFYREVDDPWFVHYMEFALAGMRLGPRTRSMDLHTRYLKGRSIRYDDPEYIRFLRGLFTEHLVAVVYRDHEKELMKALGSGDAVSLKSLFARNDLLKDDDRLCELVMLDQLYLNAHAKWLPTGSAVRMIDVLQRTSTYTEHQKIATNMYWDLTAMQVGYPLPAMRLEDLREQDVVIDSLMNGPVCLAITAGWCTYCELEMVALEKLHKEYQGIIPIVAISLDPTLDDLERYLRKHPGRDFIWLHALAEQQLREDLRMRSLPAIYLLENGTLVQAPAPMPSAGLGEWFHRAKVAAGQNDRIKVWDD